MHLEKFSSPLPWPGIVAAAFLALSTSYPTIPAEARISADAPVSTTTAENKAFAVPTLHCLGIYWSPENGGPEKAVLVKFRAGGHEEWREGLPMRYNPVDSPECKAD